MSQDNTDMQGAKLPGVPRIFHGCGPVRSIEGQKPDGNGNVTLPFFMRKDIPQTTSAGWSLTIPPSVAGFQPARLTTGSLYISGNTGDPVGEMFFTSTGFNADRIEMNRVSRNGSTPAHTFGFWLPTHRSGTLALIEDFPILSDIMTKTGIQTVDPTWVLSFAGLIGAATRTLTLSPTQLKLTKQTGSDPVLTLDMTTDFINYRLGTQNRIVLYGAEGRMDTWAADGSARVSFSAAGITQTSGALPIPGNTALYTYPMKSGTFALVEDIPTGGPFLPLAGGTLTGTARWTTGNVDTDTGHIRSGGALRGKTVGIGQNYTPYAAANADNFTIGADQIARSPYTDWIMDVNGMTRNNFPGNLAWPIWTTTGDRFATLKDVTDRMGSGSGQYIPNNGDQTVYGFTLRIQDTDMPNTRGNPQLNLAYDSVTVRSSNSMVGNRETWAKMTATGFAHRNGITTTEYFYGLPAVSGTLVTEESLPQFGTRDIVVDQLSFNIDMSEVYHPVAPLVLDGVWNAHANVADHLAGRVDIEFNAGFYISNAIPRTVSIRATQARVYVNFASHTPVYSPAASARISSVEIPPGEVLVFRITRPTPYSDVVYEKLYSGPSTGFALTH
jgi:hypothetical protein